MLFKTFVALKLHRWHLLKPWWSSPAVQRDSAWRLVVAFCFGSFSKHAALKCGNCSMLGLLSCPLAITGNTYLGNGQRVERKNSQWILCSQLSRNKKVKQEHFFCCTCHSGWSCSLQSWTTWLYLGLKFGWTTQRLTCTRFTHLNRYWNWSVYCLEHRTVSKGKSNHQNPLPLQLPYSTSF